MKLKLRNFIKWFKVEKLQHLVNRLLDEKLMYYFINMDISSFYPKLMLTHTPNINEIVDGIIVERKIVERKRDRYLYHIFMTDNIVWEGKDDRGYHGGLIDSFHNFHYGILQEEIYNDN